MKILSLDTSTKIFSLAVFDGKKILAQRNVKLKRVLSASIIPGIQQILKKAHVSLPQLDGVAIGLGPGSFTSLRVGCATVKGLTFAIQKPVVGISSLDAIAQGLPSQSMPQRRVENICVVCDARRSLVYAAFYVKQNGRLVRKGKYLLAGIQEVLKRIEKPTLLTGNGIELFREEIMKHTAGQIFLADEEFWYPKALHLAQLAYPKFLKKEYNDPDSLVPLYLYPKDCQVVR